MRPAVVGPNEPDAYARRRLRRARVVDACGPSGTAAGPRRASRRSLSFACAMSRATIIGPVSESRVLIGYCDELRADLAHRPVEVDLHDARRRGRRRVVSGRYLRRVGLELLEEDAVRA